MSFTLAKPFIRLSTLPTPSGMAVNSGRTSPSLRNLSAWFRRSTR